MFQEINQCRVCANSTLIKVVELGEMCLTGYFPKTANELVPSGPLTLVKCHRNDKTPCCGLLQLKHNYKLSALYGDHYGYLSSLNSSMVDHLTNKVRKIEQTILLHDDDLVIDIGSNDATTLKSYSNQNLTLVGIDPAGKKFSTYYPKHIKLISDFFNLKSVKKIIGEKKAKVITSFSMFYDLPDPLKFARHIHSLLDNDGIWILEQSYMPEMLKQLSFDTICHEHLEYYSLSQINWIAERAGLKILDVEFNNINGGSFSIIVAKAVSTRPCYKDHIQSILDKEKRLNLDTLDPYQQFNKSIIDLKNHFNSFLHEARKKNKTIGGIGASTKGNVILQFFGITKSDVACIGEINCEKVGSYTPGTQIPIISENQLLNKNYDYILVLPWHFKDYFEKSKKFQSIRSCLIYPLTIGKFFENNYKSRCSANTMA